MDMAQVHKQSLPLHVAEHFKAYTASGKTIKEYCIEAGIPPQTFYTWRKKYRQLNKHSQRPLSPLPATQHFSTLGSITLADIRRPLFDIHVPGECRVSIYSGTTAQELAPFLELLSPGRRPC
jgi:hypothetical protein